MAQTWSFETSKSIFHYNKDYNSPIGRFPNTTTVSNFHNNKDYNVQGSQSISIVVVRIFHYNKDYNFLLALNSSTKLFKLSNITRITPHLWYEWNAWTVSVFHYNKDYNYWSKIVRLTKAVYVFHYNKDYNRTYNRAVIRQTAMAFHYNKDYDIWSLAIVKEKAVLSIPL